MRLSYRLLFADSFVLYTVSLEKDKTESFHEQTLE